MKQQTTVAQRAEFYQRHQTGESYQEIAERLNISKACVRYWCRRQRDGGDCQHQYQRQASGLLSRFDAKVKYGILRLKLEHPRWGPRSIRNRLSKRPSLSGLALPKEAQIGRYLHQWTRFRRTRRRPLSGARPQQPVAVHQRWQIDFKLGIKLADGDQVNLHTVWDPVGEACLGAILYPSGRAGQPPHKVTAAQVQATLRRCFARWATLPAQVQTDGETTLVSHRQGDFPTNFTLWLIGLGIDHQVIRPGQPTDNAEVERGHRTIYEYAIVGQEDQPWPALQTSLDEAVDELLFELPSRAEGCAGQPPSLAHPELFQPPRPFRPELELAQFDLGRVDTYLASQTWYRQTGKSGQVTLAGHRYFVSLAHTYRQIAIRFDPADRHFVFYDGADLDQEIVRRPAKGLTVEALTGLALWPEQLGPQQLPLPLFTLTGVSF
jgi:transposase InsO family protein